MKDIRNLYIFSSDRGWKAYLRTFTLVLTALITSGYAFIVIVDPFDSLSFSPDFDRVPVDENGRYFYPGLARKAEFDSAIIGTSSIRLLRPDLLNSQFDSRFVNLGMNAASVFEQEDILTVFLRHHPTPKTLIFGVDHVYFYEHNFKRYINVDVFPEWMYDENPYNDLLPFDATVWKCAWRQFFHLTGLKTYKYGRDGYTDFTKPMREYDLNRARMKIYGSVKPKLKQAIIPPTFMTPEAVRSIRFPSLSILERMLDKVPDETLKIIFITPLHHFSHAAQGSEEAIQWEEFKRRIAILADNRSCTYALDFNIDSPITREDRHYWDITHYTVQVAARLPELIAEGVKGSDLNPYFVRLSPITIITGGKPYNICTRQP
jgi:hypothetical protein